MTETSSSNLPDRARAYRIVTFAALVFVGLIVFGTLAFRLISSEPWNEAFFRSLSAFTPSGIVPEADQPGERLITALLVVSASVFFLLAVGTVIKEVGSRVIEEDFHERRARRRMEKIEGQFIVCGYGNVGKAVVKALLDEQKAVVVIDNSPEHLEEARRGKAVETVLGGASDPDVLVQAGIDRAAGLVACVGSDAENLYILLAAQKRRNEIEQPEFSLAARASDAANRDRLVAAVKGLEATSPYEAAGRDLVDLVLKPRSSLAQPGDSGS